MPSPNANHRAAQACPLAWEWGVKSGGTTSPCAALASPFEILSDGYSSSIFQETNEYRIGNANSSLKRLNFLNFRKVTLAGGHPIPTILFAVGQEIAPLLVNLIKNYPYIQGSWEIIGKIQVKIFPRVSAIISHLPCPSTFGDEEFDFIIPAQGATHFWPFGAEGSGNVL